MRRAILLPTRPADEARRAILLSLRSADEMPQAVSLSPPLVGGEAEGRGGLAPRAGLGRRPPLEHFGKRRTADTRLNRWAGRGPLERGRSQSISNELLHDRAMIQLTAGTAAAAHHFRREQLP